MMPLMGTHTIVQQLTDPRFSTSRVENLPQAVAGIRPVTLPTIEDLEKELGHGG